MAENNLEVALHQPLELLPSDIQWLALRFVAAEYLPSSELTRGSGTDNGRISTTRGGADCGNVFS